MATTKPRKRSANDRDVPAQDWRMDLSRTLGRAELALRCGRFEEAAVLATRVSTADPTHIGALETLAKAQWRSSQHEELLTTVSRLLRLNPYEPGYHALRGAALQCLGRYGESVQAFSRCGGDASSKEAIRSLHEWQAGLVAEMMKTDKVFKAHYEQSPTEACSSRGFAFVAEERAERWLTNGRERATFFTRPS